MDGEVRKVDLFRNRPKGGKGFLMIDNRASGGELLELPTLTCCHCNSVVVLNAMRKSERGFCFTCNAFRCDDKKCADDCYSMKRSIDLIMADPTIPALPRAKDGGLLFDPELLTRKTQF